MQIYRFHVKEAFWLPNILTPKTVPQRETGRSSGRNLWDACMSPLIETFETDPSCI